jgi:hypothetical protein
LGKNEVPVTDKKLRIAENSNQSPEVKGKIKDSSKLLIWPYPMLALLPMFAFAFYYVDNIGNALFAEWSVAFGTSALASATFLALIISDINQKKQARATLNRIRLDDFYSPLIEIFSADPEPIKNDRRVIERKADLLVEVLRRKRHLATPETAVRIPDNIEQIAYGNWLQEAAYKRGDPHLLPIIGYLRFSSKEEMDPWTKLVKQLWKDYVLIAKELGFSWVMLQVEPTWRLQLVLGKS